MLIKRKTGRRDMADVNVYTASRLSGMAASLSQLARAFSDEDETGRLSKVDGKMAKNNPAAIV